MASKYEGYRAFPSMAALVDYTSKPSGVASEVSRETSRPKWHGTKDWDEAVLLAHGWAEGAAMIERVRATLKVHGVKSRQSVVMSEVGPGTLNMGNLLSGHPQPYVTLRDNNKRKAGKGRVVRVVVNVAASWGIGAEVIERRGAAVVALIDCLESAGRRVEVVAMACNTPTVARSGPARLVHTVQVKHAEAKANLSVLAFALAHPSFNRRFMFAAMEREAPGLFAGYVDGMGMPSDPVIAPRADIYLGKMHASDRTWASPESAAQWVRDRAAEQGVTIK